MRTNVFKYKDPYIVPPAIRLPGMNGIKRLKYFCWQ